MSSEFDLIRRWCAALPRGSGVLVGPGDDCAVLEGDGCTDRVLTCDVLVEGRHFLREGLDPTDLGWKALAVSVSDVCAMGGRARHAVVSLVLPAELTGDFAEGFASGLGECARRFGVGIVGGDVSASPGPVVVDVALLGEVPSGRAVLRSGARVGDALCVSGPLGGSLLGRHLRPTPRQDLALRLVQAGMASAMIDLSDGLSSDLGHVLQASGVGAELLADRIPIHPDARRAAELDGRSALAHALDDGEDFELLFSCSQDVAEQLAAEGSAVVVGRVLDQDGATLRGADGSVRPLVPGGHDHFRAEGG